MIIKDGRKWVLKSKDGKRVLGVHPSRSSAQTQERAILINQAKEKKNS